MGLRERKKEQTRRRIAETAQRLFADRGFAGVTVVEVAREAEVAEATVFNYFPTKEDLFYSGLESFGEALLDAVGNRPAGEPVLVAVQSFLLGVGGQLDRIAAGDRKALDQARTTARIIEASPALRAREQQAIGGIADALAALIAAGAHPRSADDMAADDPVAGAVANALMGVHRALIGYARRRILADDRPAAIATDLRAHGRRAFELLEHGLRDYARTPPVPTPDPRRRRKVAPRQ